MIHQLWATLGRVQLLAPLAAGDRRHRWLPGWSDLSSRTGPASRLLQPSRTAGTIGLSVSAQNCWCACLAPIVMPRRCEKSTAGSPCLRRTCRCRSLFPWRWESRARAIRGTGRCTSGSMGRPPAPRASSIFPSSRWCWPASWRACRKSIRPRDRLPARTTSSAAARWRPTTPRRARRSRQCRG